MNMIEYTLMSKIGLHMRVDDFDYTLPQEMIAQHPSEQRELSKMMVLDPNKKGIVHSHFYNILEYITPEDLIVINNTKVIPARVFGKKETGANIEVFLIQNVDSTTWKCLLKPQKRIRPGTRIIIDNKITITAKEKANEENWLIETPINFEKELEAIGNMPLPPYIKREVENEFKGQDKNRYQTVYAKVPGAVAAPTAGLHFTPDIIQKLKQQGTKVAEITLHVGLGTFQPIRCENIKDHIMHEEYFSVSEEVASLINQQKAEQKRVIPIGTTSVRTLETIAKENNGIIKAGSGLSDIFIYPGFEFKITDACITNFHLPKSTLIMLVSAFAGKEFVFRAYEEAIKNDYRFYSYGDCMLISAF